MDKSTIEQFISNLEAADIKEYCIRYCDGNQIATHGNDSGYIAIGSDTVTVIETRNNYMKPNGAFNIKEIPYEDISYVFVEGLTVAQTIKYLQTAGVEMTDELKLLLAKRGGKITIKPSDGNVKFDEKGDEKLDKLDFPRVND